MNREKEINILKCWLIRNAQLRWHKTPCEIVNLFNYYHIYKFVEEAYELLHVSSYESTLNEIEEILKVNGVDVYAKP